MAAIAAGLMLAAAVILLLVGRDRGQHQQEETIMIEGTDKARYAPGEEVLVSLTVCN